MVMISGKHYRELKGFSRDTTNNRMELTAALKGLKAIRLGYRRVPVILYSDSTYVVQGINRWMKNWKASGWKSKNKDIKNLELWQELDHWIQKFMDLKAIHVKGHSGIKHNEWADRLANDAMDEGSKYEEESMETQT